jgi:transcriptional regulator
MYIPRHYRWKNNEQVLDFISQYPFALLSTGGEIPIVTHLPFVTRMEGETLMLSSHMAIENPQSKGIEGSRVLVIFQHPHAYIAPAWYEKEINVPTWNYLAVHCYGTCRIMESREEKEAQMQAFFGAFDPAFATQYAALPETYLGKMYEMLTAFEIKVDDIQAKAKVSQNKTRSEQQNIITQLKGNDSPVENELSDWMKKIVGQG